MKVGQIAVIGRPNVGKSTLINHLIGQKISIVSRKPQTTRQRIRGVVTTDRAQFVFVDTPGFQTQHKSALNTTMNRYVTQSLSEVDVVLFVMAGANLTQLDRNIIALIPAATPAIAVVNKIDLIADKSTLAATVHALSAMREFAAIVPVSAERGTQLSALLAEIEKLMPTGELIFDADALTDRDERFLAAELVREKVFRQLGDEVPYGCTVIIERFEQVGELRRIFAAILVNDENHKPILLGKSGERMKKIATAARMDMENLFGGKVYLEVFVKVRSGWAESVSSLRKLGYET